MKRIAFILGLALLLPFLASCSLLAPAPAPTSLPTATAAATETPTGMATATATVQTKEEDVATEAQFASGAPPGMPDRAIKHTWRRVDHERLPASHEL
jgi:hypothetical protein